MSFEKPLLSISNAIALLPRSAFELLHQNPERFLIMAEIARRRCTFKDLHTKLKLPKSTLHRHLKLLQLHGWITQVKTRLNTRSSIYVPTALVYLGLDVSDDKLTIVTDHIAVISPYCSAFTVKIRNKPIFTSCSGDSCEKRVECVRELRRLCKKLGIDAIYDEPTELTIEVFKEVALHEIKSIFQSQLITIPMEKSRIIYRELLISTTSI